MKKPYSNKATVTKKKAAPKKKKPKKSGPSDTNSPRANGGARKLKS